MRLVFARKTVAGGLADADAITSALLIFCKKAFGRSPDSFSGGTTRYSPSGHIELHFPRSPYDAGSCRLNLFFIADL